MIVKQPHVASLETFSAAVYPIRKTRRLTLSERRHTSGKPARQRLMPCYLSILIDIENMESLKLRTTESLRGGGNVFRSVYLFSPEVNPVAVGEVAADRQAEQRHSGSRSCQIWHSSSGYWTTAGRSCGFRFSDNSRGSFGIRYL